jgi:hypothetical protein
MSEHVDNLIALEEPKARFFAQVPNLIFEMKLSTNAIALYGAIKRSAGDASDGRCTRSTRTLARNAGMNPASVVRAKRELARLGLIHIEEVDAGRGRKAHHIAIRSIWSINIAFFSLKVEERPAVSAGCKWGLDDDGNLAEFEVVKDGEGQVVDYVSFRTVLLVPEMERRKNQRGKTKRENQQQQRGEKNGTHTGADAVVADSPSFSSSSPARPEPADAPSESQADPENSSNGGRAKANRDALAEYGVAWTQAAQAVGTRPGMTPALIHAWGQHLQARPDVNNKPGYLVTALRTATEPPSEPMGGNRRHRTRHRRGPPDDWPTKEEQATAWEKHGERLLTWIRERGTDENLIVCVVAIGKTLNVDSRTANALVLAYEARKPCPSRAVILDDVD